MEQLTEKFRIPPEILFAAVEEELSHGHKASFTVTGMSMWPFLCHGRDQVVLTSCTTDQLKVGDIILFQMPLGNYMLHRITGIRDGQFQTTGDGNCFCDGWFSFDCVRGRVETITRKEKVISCDSIRWRFVFRLWMMLFPVRRPLLRLLRKIGQLKHRKHRKHRAC